MRAGLRRVAALGVIVVGVVLLSRCGPSDCAHYRLTGWRLDCVEPIP